MYNMIVGQCFYSKNKDNKFVCYKFTSEMFSEYTNKVYNSLNKLLHNCKIDKDLNKVDEFIISEVILRFQSNLEELNIKNDEYLSLEEFLENEKLCLNLEKINLEFCSEINSEFSSEEIKQIISILRISIQKDIINLLKKEGYNLNIL